MIDSPTQVGLYSSHQVNATPRHKGGANAKAKGGSPVARLKFDL